MENQSYIYALRHPKTGEARYVGQTQKPKERARMHATGGYCNREKRRWVKGLRAEGLRPVFDVVESCPPEDADEREEYWIKRMIIEGHRLTNKNFGGQTWHSKKKWSPQDGCQES